MKINLLKRKKTVENLLSDLERKLIVKKIDENGTYKRTKESLLFFSDFIGLKPKECERLLNYGLTEAESKNKKFLKNINEVAKIFNIPFYHNVSPLYDRNTYTEKNFKKLFSNIKNKKLKKGETWLGQTGLNMLFSNSYIIPSYIVTAYDKKDIKNCIEKLGKEIFKEIKKFNSLIEFYLTFLTVRKITKKTTF